MCLNLNDYQFKTRRYISGLVNIIELHDNHNQKTQQIHRKQKEENKSIKQKEIIKPQKGKQRKREKEETERKYLETLANLPVFQGQNATPFPTRY